MTRKSKASPGKRSTRKLKLKRETIKDLGPKSRGSGVKGGLRVGGSIVTCTCFSCVYTCKDCKAMP
jgi:hypothetical protein